MDNKTILIVEDDRIVLNSFERILSEAGHKIITADNGKEALEILQGNKVDIVLSDIVMKDVDGLKVLEETNKISPETDVILITGFGSITNILEALRKNAVDFIMKPCKDDELVSRVQNVIKKQTDRRLAQDTIMYKKMIEALGAVAHEINNPLTAIIGSAELLGLEYPENEEASTIMESAVRIAEIVKTIREIKGIKTKRYTKDSEILDLQKSSEFTVSARKTVLVVDDEIIVSRTTSKILQRSGYEVDIANSGSEALKKIESHNYSIVILDVSMPEMDGYETLKLINKYYTDKKIRIPATIMYTGFDVDEILLECKKIGAFTVLQKPVIINELLGVVREAEEFASSKANGS